MEPTEQVLKTDEAGRVWTPKEKREALLDEFERSGVSATKFAAMVGVNYPIPRLQDQLDSEAAESAVRGSADDPCIEVGGGQRGVPASMIGAGGPEHP